MRLKMRLKKKKTKSIYIIDKHSNNLLLLTIKYKF